MRDQFRGELDDSRPGDVGQDDVERAVDSAQRIKRRLQAAAHTVDVCIASSRLDCIDIDVGSHDSRRAESKRTQSEDAASAADVEYPLPADDPTGKLFDDLTRGRVVAAAESAGSELDQPREVPAIMLRPRQAHAESVTEGDGARVPIPRLERSTTVGSRDRHHALSPERHGEAGRTLRVLDRGQHHPTGVAGRHNINRAHAEGSEPVAHPGEFAFGCCYDDHRDAIPQSREGSGLFRCVVLRIVVLTVGGKFSRDGAPFRFVDVLERHHIR